MRTKLNKHTKKLLCLVSTLSLCISSTAMAAANIGDVYTLADGSLSLRVCGNDSVSVCGYNASKKSNLELDPGYRLSGPDGNMHVDENGNEISFHVTAIEDKVFSRQTYKYIYIDTYTGMKIGKSAFEGATVTGNFWWWDDTVKITGGELAELGNSAFAETNIDGNLTIENMNGSIGTGAFRNMKLDGKLTIMGNIDTLGDYSLSGMSLKGLSMPAVIRHMGDGVYKDTELLSGFTLPLSNSLKSIGSKVFEGTNLAGIQLPEVDTVERAAVDAFPDVAGMLIIIPEGLTNLAVFHFDQYKNLTFQTAEDLSDNSPVIRYLEENGLTYKKGSNGQIIHPEPAETPAPTEPTSPAALDGTQASPPAASPAKPDETQTSSSAKPTTSTAPDEAQTSSSAKPTASLKPDETQTPASAKPTASAKPSETQTPASAKPTASTKPNGTEEPDSYVTPAPNQDEAQASGEPSAITQTPGIDFTPGADSSPVTDQTADSSGPKEPSQEESPAPSGIPANDLPATEETKNSTYSVGAAKYRLLGKNKIAVTGPADKNCTSLSIPSIVTIEGKLYQVSKIEKQAFKGMKKLKKVKIGNHVKQIGDEAFAKCPKLKSIQFGTGLTSIGKKALYQDKKLRKITIKGTKLKKIGKKTFSGIPSKKLTIKVKRSKLKYYQKLIKKAK